ncbi:MAG: autotransporter outer membrane beta-barrel domain-containing protein, partial [Comamonadaceae bacterium]
ALGANTLNLGGATPQVFAGAIGGTGGIVKQGIGSFTLSGNSTYSGATIVSGGVLRMGVANALASSTAVTLANTAGVSLDLNGFSQSIGSLNGGGITGGNVSLGAGILSLGSNNASTSYAGVISGTGGITKVGTGTQTLTAANTYTGGTTVQAGTLALSGAGSLAATAPVAVTGAGATFSIGGASTDLTIGALSGVAGSTVALGGRTLIFGDATNRTIGSAVTGTGAFFVKQGTGIVSLSGTNTYTGVTIINGGTLAINGSVAGSVITSNGGTVAGSGTIGGDLIVDKNGTLSAGNSPGTLTVAGNLTMYAGSTSVFELGQSGTVGGVSNDLVRVGGSLALAGTLQATASSAGFYRLFDYG